VGLRAGLDAVVKRKISAAAGTRTPDHPVCSPALYHSAIPALLHSVVTKEMMMTDTDHENEGRSRAVVC
jgi:hypothetical protein